MRNIVIMPGGFHPFHAGHAALYQSAVEAFPNADVYVAATNDTKTRPFPFAIKEKLAKLAGVAQGHFIQVKSPFKAEEITSHYNPKAAPEFEQVLRARLSAHNDDRFRALQDAIHNVGRDVEEENVLTIDGHSLTTGDLTLTTGTTNIGTITNPNLLTTATFTTYLDANGTPYHYTNGPQPGPLGDPYNVF